MDIGNVPVRVLDGIRMRFCARFVGFDGEEDVVMLTKTRVSFLDRASNSETTALRSCGFVVRE